MSKTSAWVLLLLLAVSQITAQERRAAAAEREKPAPGQPHSAFSKIVTQLRAATKVPLRLPALLPYVDEKNDVFAKLDSVDSSHYEILLGWTADCAGQHVCSYGSIYGSMSPFKKPEEDAGDSEHRRRLKIEPVELQGGMKGEFIDAVCHAYCSESYVRWSENGFHYAIGTKAENKEILVEVANSAIETGIPR